MPGPKLRFKNEDGKDFPPPIPRKFIEIADKISDGIHSTPKYDVNGKYFFINGNNLINGQIEITPSTKKIAYDQYLLHKSDLNNQSILLSINGTIGNLAFYDNQEVVLGKSACYINLKSTINKKYVYQLLQTPIIKNYFEQELTGSTIKNLSLTTIKNTSAEFPVEQEQTKIANFLTAVDSKISQLTKKHELLTLYKKGVMQKIFSQELRFKDGEGREFAEWVVTKIADLNLYISDGNYGEQYPTSDQMVGFGIPFIRANNIKGLKLVWDDMRYITPDHHKILTSGHLKPNDILITTRGEIGSVAFVNDEFGGANINAQICLLRVQDIQETDPKYLIQALTQQSAQKQFKELQTGSALKQLPKSSLGKVTIQIPCLLEQTKIANFLIAIDDKITNVKSQLEAAKEYKQGLLQQMFV